MDVRAFASPSRSPAYFGEQVARLTGWTVATAFGLCLALSGLLLARRAAGALQQTLDGVTLILVAIAAALATTLLRLVWRRQERIAPSVSPLVLRLLLPSTAVFVLSTSLSLPGTPVWAVALLWLTVAGEEGIWWLVELRGRTAGRSTHSGTSAATGARRQTLPGGAGGQPDSPRGRLADSTLFGAVVAGEGPLPADVSQQITRRRDEHGGEVICGLLRGDFAPGERWQNLHLAFCPPLESKPSLTAEQIDGPAATIKLAQVETFGARLELRLASRARMPESVVVQFDVRATPRESQT